MTLARARPGSDAGSASEQLGGPGATPADIARSREVSPAELAVMSGPHSDGGISRIEQKRQTPRTVAASPIFPEIGGPARVRGGRYHNPRPRSPPPTKRSIAPHHQVPSTSRAEADLTVKHLHKC